MLSQVKIDNFRCLVSVDVPLRPLTVLIGPNNTGKSAFLDAIRILGQDQIVASDHWRMESTAVRIEGFAEGESFAVADVPDGGNRHSGPSSLIAPVGIFRPPVAGVKLECEGFSENEHQLPVGVEGEQVAAVLDFLLRTDRDRFFQIVTSLKELVPGLEDVLIETPSSSKRRVDLLMDGGLRIRGEAASAGVKLLIFFVTLSHHPKPPKTILIEEPENGMHPQRLADVMHLLKGMTLGQRTGSPSQVIVTTHSPYLLDLVNIDEHQVLVFRKRDDGSRTVSPVDNDRLRNFLDEFMLGEVWFNQSEDGLVNKG